MPDAKTIWLYREQLTRAGAIERLFAGFDAALRDAGYLAMGGQIVDATVVEARRPRLTEDEKATVKGGGVPAGWSQAKRAQMDTDGRWTIKRGRRRRRPIGEPQAARHRRDRGAGVRLQEPPRDRPPARLHPPLRRSPTPRATTAASSAGCSTRTTPRAPVWADSAYRSAANVALLARRGLVPQFQRPKPRGKPMPPHLARGNASRARVRVAIEHVFAAQKCRLGLVIRSVGLARATARLGLANLVTNMRRLVWFETRAAPA